MNEIVNVSRRDFLHIGLLAGGGLVLGLRLPSLAKGQGPARRTGRLRSTPSCGSGLTTP
jgi:hypothetical protein